MKAIILAAGYATRLYPLTKNTPKSLLPVAGKPLLEYTLDKIAACSGIDSVCIVTNNKFFKVFQNWRQNYLSKHSAGAGLGIEVLNDGTSSEGQRLGSIGDLQFVIGKVRLADDVLVICSDKIFEFSLQTIIDNFNKRQTPVNACFDTRDIEVIRNRHGCLVLDADRRIVEFQEKPAQPKSSIESIAFYIFPAATLPLVEQYLAEGNNPDASGNYIRWLCSRVPVYACLVTEDCLDVGTLSSYREVDEIYREKLKG